MSKGKLLKATIIAKGTEIAVYSASTDDPDFKLVEFDQFKNGAGKEWGGKKL